MAMFEGKRPKELQTYKDCDQKELDLMPTDTNWGAEASPWKRNK